jgi:CCR4-NOT transcription complex subunit 4
LGHIPSHISHHQLDFPSRTSTPSVPPGFDLPHAHPSPTIRDESNKSHPRILPPSVAFTSPRSTASSHVPRVATPLSTVSVPQTPVQAVAVPKMTETPRSQPKQDSRAKQDIKSLAANTGLSKAIASQAAQATTNITTSAPVLQPEDFPTLEKGKAKEVIIPSGPRAMTGGKKSVTTSAAPSVPAKILASKPTPGILNITVPIQAAAKEATVVEMSSKTTVNSSAFPPLPPSTPASAIAPTPTTRTGPKTLRVIPTPKAESPPVGVQTPLSAVSNHHAGLSSKAPSVTSVSKFDRPSTPASEIISDNASLTSASLSRPSSPPPNRVGSAPVRVTTKSQQKKQRREGKGKLDLEPAAATPEPEEIAPIMGRKKKQKKAKVDSVAGGSTPVTSRPPSPRPSTSIEEVKSSKAKAETPATKSKEFEPETNSKGNDSKWKGKPKAEERIPTPPPPPTVETVEESAEKPVPTPAAVLRELISTGILPDPEKLSVFKAPVVSNQRLDNVGDLQDLDHKLVITEEDRTILLSGQPVHKKGCGINRIMLTPNGDCVRNLTPAEEERYLELQSRIFQESGPAAFVPARHNATNGFTLIGGRAVPNGPPAFFSPIDGNNTSAPLDPVSKIQRDEALSYINQYVLPSLSTNSQLERALNANALDSEMLRPNDSQTWGGWGVGVGHGVDALGAQGEHHARTETPYGANKTDGILATGLESMTAHFAVGRDNSRSQPLGNVTLLSLSDAESAMQSSKKESEKLEKTLNQLLKKNRRLLLGAGH